MSLTREQRLAAGWERFWGVFDYEDDTWLCADGKTWSSVPGARWWGAVYSAARVECGNHSLARAATTRPFWRRKKPKPSAFKFGDFVTVRGRVAKAGDGLLDVSSLSGREFCVRESDVERVERP